MTPFSILLLAHLVGDYLFQTSWMAANKARHWLPLTVHSLVYTFWIILFAWFGFGGLSLGAILLIFVSHLILDQRSFVQWWVSTIMRTQGKEAGWLSIMVDQIFHLLILALALYITFSP